MADARYDLLHAEDFVDTYWKAMNRRIQEAEVEDIGDAVARHGRPGILTALRTKDYEILGRLVELAYMDCQAEACHEEALDE